MAIPIRIAIIVLAAFLTRPPGPVIASGEPPIATIDGTVARWMESTGIPGTSVAIVRHGETIHLAGYGVAYGDGRSVTADTPFLIGSVSKPFTAAAVFQLVDEGRLRLDDPIRPHLDAATERDTAAFEGITIEHLLMHTSGMPMSLGLPGTAPVRTGSDALERRVGDIVDQHARTAAPADGYAYSNANYILLAWAVERASGTPFASYVEDHVFAPLGMDASFATDASPSAADVAIGHESWFGRWVPSDQPYDPAGAAMGYMGSTGRDLASFLHAQLGEKPVPALPVRASDVVARTAVPTGWDVPLETHIAEGWFVDEVAGHRTVSHAGSLGDYTAHVIMVPEADGLGIAVMQNASAFIAAGHEGQYGLSLQLLELMLGVEPEARGFSALMTLVAPAVAWGLALLIAGSALRFLVRGSPRRSRGRAAVTGRALSVLGLVSFGLLVLIAIPPLAGGTWTTAQLFYPDVARGLLVAGYVAIGAALARAGLELVEVRRRRA